MGANLPDWKTVRQTARQTKDEEFEEVQKAYDALVEESEKE